MVFEIILAFSKFPLILAEGFCTFQRRFAIKKILFNN